MGDEEYDSEVATWRGGGGGDSPTDRFDSLYSQMSAWSVKFEKKLHNMQRKADDLDREFHKARKALHDSEMRSQQAVESQMRRQLEEHEKKTRKQISILAFLFFLLFLGFAFLSFEFLVRGVV